MIRGRLRRHRGGGESSESPAPADEYIEIDPAELTGIIHVPGWLRDLGVMAWLLVGVGLLIGGLIWILGLTEVIVAPVIAASVMAAVASPLVARLSAHGVPRPIAAILVLLLIVAAGFGMTLIVINGITGQSSDITSQVDSAKDHISSWLQDLGLDPSKADQATAEGQQSVTDSG